MKVVIAILVAAGIGLVIVWLTLLAYVAALRPNGTTLRDAVRLLPDTIRLVHRLSRDATLSRGVRLRLALLTAYLAFPIDVVPDFIPVIGYADDALVTGFVLRGVIRRAGAEVVRSHWTGSDAGLAVLSRLCRVPQLEPPR